MGLYITAYSGFQEWHGVLGYAVTLLIAWRLLWGVVGTRHARFAGFLYRPAVILSYLRALAIGRPGQYLGHDPAGGVMVVVLLLALLAMAGSGWVLLATVEFEGPLQEALTALSDQAVANWFALHHGMSEALLWLIGFHVLGVLVVGALTGQRLVRAMLTGMKHRDDRSAG